MDRVVPASPPEIEMSLQSDSAGSYERPVPPLYTKNERLPQNTIYTPPSIHSITSNASSRSARSLHSPSPVRKSDASNKTQRNPSTVSNKRPQPLEDDSSGYLMPAPPLQVSFAPDVESGDEYSPQAMRRRKRRRRWKKKAQGMDYLVDDVPPWYLCIPMAMQHLVVMFGATVSLPISLAPYLCLPEGDTAVVSDLIGTLFFCSGVSTFLQSTVGVRLPIVQGGAYAFLPPTVTLLSLDRWNCSDAERNASMSSIDVNVTYEFSYFNDTNATAAGTVDAFNGGWKARIREIQGGIIVASLVQVLVGFSGITGFILRYLGPLAVAPTVALIGLGLFDAALFYASQQWWITLVTIVLIAAFSQYSKNLNVPCFEFKRGKGFQKVPFPLFRLFPVILAVAFAWILHLILVESGALPLRETDRKGIHNLYSANWFRFPYPFQWGIPTITVASVFGMLAAVLSSLAESIGDYYACARISYAAAPPVHAVNRGLGVEGLCVLVSGLWGTGTGTTSYTENVGAIGITKVASRRVVQFAAAGMIILGVFGKIGVFFVLIPAPVIGGVFIVMFGMVTAVGLSNLQFVDLNSTRNLFIIGCAFFLGLTIPAYIQDNPSIIKTGNDVVNSVVVVLLSTNMFVGGLVAFLLDNTIPGTDEVRGLTKWREYSQVSDKQARIDEANQMPTRAVNVYDIPWLRRCLSEANWTQYVPFLPSFNEEIMSVRKKKKKKSRSSRRPSQAAV